MHWPRDAATRIAERQARESLERYMKLRSVKLSDVWAEAVTEARRRDEAVSRLDRQLQHLG